MHGAPSTARVNPATDAASRTPRAFDRPDLLSLQGLVSSCPVNTIIL